ncbi:hypothetical protein LVJ94_45475 [Pendulispora rubella]|uniref:Uncharacterized protein n=1 Tax=Pendulispora rubella TaxID=2741070 RepID=A0ABZ2KZP4_9BACT
MRKGIWGDIAGRVAMLLAALTLVPAGYAGCRTNEEERDGAEAGVRGVYSMDAIDGKGDMALLSFFDDQRYWLWKNMPECRVSADIDACGEWGRYVVAGAELTLTDDRTRTTRSFPFQRRVAQKLPSLTPAGMPIRTLGEGLVNGGSQLMEESRPLASEVSVGERVMRLIERPIELLTTCEANEAGSGAIPGAQSPGANFERGVFRSGEFAQGATHDTRTASTGTLFENVSSGSHRYALISERLPAGTTWEEANAALQRFNGPTAPALRGDGDDPNATKGWVVDPVFNLPVGCVTFERGDGWARNTTQWNHPFIGTITRWVVDGGDCSYRILTVGEGQGGSLENTSSLLGEGITAARHLGNVMGGPAIFEQLDEQLLKSVRPARPGGGC